MPFRRAPNCATGPLTEGTSNISPVNRHASKVRTGSRLSASDSRRCSGSRRQRDTLTAKSRAPKAESRSILREHPLQHVRILGLVSATISRIRALSGVKSSAAMNDRRGRGCAAGAVAAAAPAGGVVPDGTCPRRAAIRPLPVRVALTRKTPFDAAYWKPSDCPGAVAPAPAVAITIPFAPPSPPP